MTIADDKTVGGVPKRTAVLLSVVEKGREKSLTGL